MNTTALPAPAGPPVIAAWLGLILGLVLLVPGWQAVQPARAQVIHPGPVVLHADRHGQYSTWGRVDGVHAPLLVDTGAAEVVVPAHIAVRAGLSAGEKRRYRAVSGVVEGYRTRIQLLQIGPLTLRDVPATIVPEGEEILLGMSALRHLNMVQRDGRLVLYATP